MKKILILALVAFATLFNSCSKKKDTPTPSNVITYTFMATSSGNYVVNYYDPASLGIAQNVTASTWSGAINIPAGTKTANIFFTAAQNPPYSANNNGTVTIKLNGKVVANGSTTFISVANKAEAYYNYTTN